MMLLGDDGTLDTVIVCSECGAEMRFNYDGADHDIDDERTDEQAYDDFVQWAKEQAAEDHKCIDHISRGDTVLYGCAPYAGRVLHIIGPYVAVKWGDQKRPGIYHASNARKYIHKVPQ